MTLSKYVCCLAVSAAVCNASSVIVTNIIKTPRAGTPIVDVYYDLIDSNAGTYVTTMEVSTNGGLSYTALVTDFTGDIGQGITTGLQKHIEWYAATDFPHDTGASARVRISVTDCITNTEEMVYIPGGTFVMGNCFEDETYPAETYIHRVYVSDYYIDIYEVSKAKWDVIYNWAVTNGYQFDNPGEAKGGTHPVGSVSWYDCVKWCNARSEKEGYTPCYYTDTMRTNVYRMGQLNLSNDWVKWEVNGYRLPTEAEWEKAGRAERMACKFPWTKYNLISHNEANFYNDWIEEYQIGTRGYHPAYSNAPTPYTSPVGEYFPPNGYGLYNLAGNVREWCWDHFEYYYYEVSPEINPRGPETGDSRSLRTGCWGSFAHQSRVSFRLERSMDRNFSVYGFRTVRSTTD